MARRTRADGVEPPSTVLFPRALMTGVMPSDSKILVGVDVNIFATLSPRSASGLWGPAAPPGASRCCARASLRTPSRPPPPLDGAWAPSDVAVSQTVGWHDLVSPGGTARL